MESAERGIAFEDSLEYQRIAWSEQRRRAEVAATRSAYTMLELMKMYWDAGNAKGIPCVVTREDLEQHMEGHI